MRAPSSCSELGGGLRSRRCQTSIACVGKISRKLDNALGLFLSVNGFEEPAVEAFSQSRPQFFLMDGADMSAVLEDRTSLPDC